MQTFTQAIRCLPAQPVRFPTDNSGYIIASS